MPVRRLVAAEAGDADEASVELLTLREAAARYGVPHATLQKRVRTGEVAATKRRAAGGLQWWVTAAAMEAVGYVPSSSRPSDAPRDTALLKRELMVAANRADRHERWARDAQAENRRLASTVQRQAQVIEEARLLLRRVLSEQSNVDSSFRADAEGWLRRLADSIPAEGAPQHGRLPEGFPRSRQAT